MYRRYRSIGIAVRVLKSNGMKEERETPRDFFSGGYAVIDKYSSVRQAEETPFEVKCSGNQEMCKPSSRVSGEDAGIG